MKEQKPFPWLPVLLGVGCVSLLCIGVLLVGGGAAYFITDRVEVPAVPEVTMPAQSAPPSDSGLTGKQHVEEFAFFDDFSSEMLNWPVYNDGTTIIQYENDAYSFQITEPDYIDWAYIPADFIPYEIWFDVQGSPGQQDGTFGVLCQYQDIDNHYYVEFNLGSQAYIIGQYLDGEDISLTKQNSEGQFWYESDAFNSQPAAVNNIGVGCYLERIKLFINNQPVDDVHVPNPLDQPGEAAFFVYTFDDADEDGYKVFFDNVDVYQPTR